MHKNCRSISWMYLTVVMYKLPCLIPRILNVRCFICPTLNLVELSQKDTVVHRFMPLTATLFQCRHISKVSQAEIVKCQTSKELLSVAARKTQDWHFDPADFGSIFRQLVDLVYEKDLSHLPWLHANRVTAIKQLIESGLNEPLSSIKGPELNQLLKSLHLNVDNLQTETLTEILSSIIYLGIPASDPVCVALLNRIFDENNPFSWTDVNNFIPVAPYCGNRALIVNRYILPKVTRLIDEVALEGHDKDMIHGIMSLVYYFGIYLDPKHRIFAKCAKRIASLISEEEIFQYWDISYSIICFIDSLNLKSLLLLHAQNWMDVFIRAMESLLENVDNLPVHLYTPIIIKCSYVKYKVFPHYSNRHMDKVYDALSHALDKKSVQMFENNLTIAELNYIIYFVLKFDFLSERLENFLLNHLHEADSFTLVTLISALNKKPPSRKLSDKIYKEFENEILRKFDEIGVGKLNRVVKFLQRYKRNDKTDQREILSKLLELFKTYSYNSEDTCKIAGYIIALSYKDDPPEFVTKKLLEAIGNSSVVELNILMNNFERMFKSRKKFFYRYYGMISEVLIQTMMKRIKETPSFSLVSETLAMLFTNRDYHLRADNDCLAQILKILPSVFQNPTFSEFSLIIYLFEKVLHYDEDIYQILEKTAIKEQQHITFRQLSNLLSSMALVGYEIKLPQFVSACLNILDKSFDDEDYYTQIFVLSSLSALKVYPEKYIRKIFSLDYLKELDAWFSEITEDVKKTIELQLLFFNRNLVLHQPQLNIPMIMDGYFPETLILDENITNPQVDSILSDVLGSEKFYRRRSLLPYKYYAE